MTKAEFQALRKQLNFTPSAAGALASLSLVSATFSIGLYLLTWESTATYVASQLFFAVGAFQAFAIVHDCGHGSFAKRKWVNTVVGHLASILCLTPYFPWKYIHHQHHVWSGNTEKDPAVSALHRWREQGRVPLSPAIAWRTWLPAIALIQQFVFATYPIKMLRAGRLNRSNAWRSFASVAIVFGTLVIVAAVFDVDVLGNFGPAWLLYLCLTEVVNTPHHIDRPSHQGKLPVWRQASTTRSCEYPPLVARLLTLNFNLHTEHHIFPTLPWYRLHKATGGVKRYETEYTGSEGLKWVLANRRHPLERVALVQSETPQ